MDIAEAWLTLSAPLSEETGAMLKAGAVGMLLLLLPLLHILLMSVAMSATAALTTPPPAATALRLAGRMPLLSATMPLLAATSSSVVSFRSPCGLLRLGRDGSSRPLYTGTDPVSGNDEGEAAPVRVVETVGVATILPALSGEEEGLCVEVDVDEVALGEPRLAPEPAEEDGAVWGGGGVRWGVSKGTPLCPDSCSDSAHTSRPARNCLPNRCPCGTVTCVTVTRIGRQ